MARRALWLLMLALVAAAVHAQDDPQEDYTANCEHKGLDVNILENANWAGADVVRTPIELNTEEHTTNRLQYINPCGVVEHTDPAGNCEGASVCECDPSNVCVALAEAGGNVETSLNLNSELVSTFTTSDDSIVLSITYVCSEEENGAERGTLSVATYQVNPTTNVKSYRFVWRTKHVCSDGLDPTLVVGIVMGGFAALLLLVLFYCRYCTSKEPRITRDEDFEDDEPYTPAHMRPKINVNVERGQGRRGHGRSPRPKQSQQMQQYPDQYGGRGGGGGNQYGQYDQYQQRQARQPQYQQQYQNHHHQQQQQPQQYRHEEYGQGGGGLWG